ncbi:MAG: hypothetical protein ACR2F6_16085 [Mycobacteriales bacterium]
MAKALFGHVTAPGPERRLAAEVAVLRARVRDLETELAELRSERILLHHAGIDHAGIDHACVERTRDDRAPADRPIEASGRRTRVPETASIG